MQPFLLHSASILLVFILNFKAMASTSESGQVKNMHNLNSLIEFIIGLGADYNPALPAIELSNLQTVLSSARAIMLDLDNKTTAYNQKVYERQILFADIRKFSARLVNAMYLTDASPQLINSAKAFHRKMTGRRASAMPTAPLDPNAEAPRTISTSQQSFRELIQHFAGLIAILRSLPNYNPNEADLQIGALETKLAILTLVNDEVAAAYTSISNARLERNKILYAPTDSIYAVAKLVKKYIKTLPNITESQFTQINSLLFKGVKKI